MIWFYCTLYTIFRQIILKKKKKNFHFHFINNLLLVLAFNKCMVCQCHIVVGIKVTNILACVPPVYIMFKYKYHTFYSQRDIMQIFKLIASQIFEIIHWTASLIKSSKPSTSSSILIVVLVNFLCLHACMQIK